MRGLPFPKLLAWIDEELRHRDALFSVPRALFWRPQPRAPYRSEISGERLLTPIGPAAGPHTQLAQNVLSAWLCGARFVELKTVQILDELEIPRPCIDMADEGYNVEWSQELKLEESAREYIHAWALVHVLPRLLDFPGPVGTVFNMSVGYDYKGITSPRMLQFMDRLQDASQDLQELRAHVARQWPELADVEIPSAVVRSVTLSTMHGCPPEEIEKIARFLLEERGLHTFVKLNPTLLGGEAVLDILHNHLGFREISIPESVFAKDLQYPQAVEILRSLKAVAARQGLTFGVKLTNTLAMANHKGYLPGEEIYMSGRALYPVTLSLFRKLMGEFQGDLVVSFSGGVDALNVATVLSCGAQTVTAASDLLKPGGYGRFRQWLEKLGRAMRDQGARSLEEFRQDALVNLDRAVAEALDDPRYKKGYFPRELPKTDQPLEMWDCVAAPCVERCPVHQDVPEYAYFLARGEYDRALAAVLRANPMPGVTGYVCPHPCEARCTRTNYDQAVAIRLLKRVAVERGMAQGPGPKRSPRRVAVVGGGPAGLSAAYFLALAGAQVTVFEARGYLGGMVNLIAPFRLPPAVLEADLRRIEELGVEVRLHSPLREPPERLLEQGFEAVFLGHGFPHDAPLGIPGEEGPGVHGALEFLWRFKEGHPPPLGTRVVVIGGGNTAIEVARIAQRLVRAPVTLVYRRSRGEMPADPEEVKALVEEGNAVVELASPVEFVFSEDRLVAVRFRRNRLGEKGPDGRPQPVPIPGSEFDLPADSAVVAIGQRAGTSFLAGSAVKVLPDGRLGADPFTGQVADGIYAGGDAVRGPASVVEALADGKRAAWGIAKALGLQPRLWATATFALSEDELLQAKEARTCKEPRVAAPDLPVPQRQGFDLVELSLTGPEVRSEAQRCLQCASFCDKCVEVCPNRANQSLPVAPVTWLVPVLGLRDGRLEVVATEEFGVRQDRQILHVVDLCNECGNCGTFCVHQGRPYVDKPRLHLRRAAFDLDPGRAFYIAGDTIWRRENGKVMRLKLGEKELVFEDEKAVVRLSTDFRVLEAQAKPGWEGRESLRPAAEMALLMRVVRDRLPQVVAAMEESHG